MTYGFWVVGVTAGVSELDEPVGISETEKEKIHGLDRRLI